MKRYKIRPLSIAWWLAVSPWFAFAFWILAEAYEMWMKLGGELLCRFI